MATLEADFENYTHLSIDKDSGIHRALVTFRVAGTYAQGDDAQLSGVGATLTAKKRNGRSISLLTAVGAQAATRLSDPTLPMFLSSVAVSGDDVTFEITDDDLTTEIASGALPTQSEPFGVIVHYTEA